MLQSVIIPGFAPEQSLMRRPNAQVIIGVISTCQSRLHPRGIQRMSNAILSRPKAAPRLQRIGQIVIIGLLTLTGLVISPI